MAIDMKYGRVETELAPGNPFGEDEPVFIIRARDALAVETIALYGSLCSRVGTSEEQIRSVEATRQGFALWQSENPDMIKVPD